MMLHAFFLFAFLVRIEICPQVRPYRFASLLVCNYPARLGCGREMAKRPMNPFVQTKAVTITGPLTSMRTRFGTLLVSNEEISNEV